MPRRRGDPAAPTAADGARFVERLEGTGPVGKALLRVGERLPAAKTAFELTENALTLEFADGLDSLPLSPKSRELARSVRADGPDVAGDRIADEFERLDRLRTVTLRAIDRAVAARGWTVDVGRTGLFGGATLWNLGETFRELTVDVGRSLTDALRAAPPADVLRRVLRADADQPAGASPLVAEFAQACVAALAAAGPIETAPRGRLAPAAPAAAPPLAAPDDAAIAEMDAWADATLDAFKRSDDALLKYDDRAYYDPAVDRWITADEWRAIAERADDGGWRSARATRVLLDLGDPRGPARALAALDAVDVDTFHYEPGDDLVGLAWRFRNERPALARATFLPRLHDDVPFAEVRAALGDPIARRHVDGRPAASDDDVADLPVGARDLDPHGRALAWARRNWRWAMADVDPLERAAREGWADVAEALDANPYLAATLLTHADRGSDQFDGPGILTAGPLLLAWSRLRPTPLLARLLLTARRTDVPALADAAEDAAARRNRTLKPADVAMAKQVARSWWEQMQLPMAIAWRRWRDATS